MPNCPACADAGFSYANQTVEPCDCSIGHEVQQMTNHLGPWFPIPEPPPPPDPPRPAP